MEKKIGNMMVINMNGEYLSSNTADQSRKLKKYRKRKSKNQDGGNCGVSLSKRKLTDDQAARLELYFESEPRLETERKERIAAELSLEPRQVAVWFQNRRVRCKCKKLEVEFSNMRGSYDLALARNAKLKVQILELSQRLVESEGEIQRLSARFEGSTQSYGNMTTTPSISIDEEKAFPMEVVHLLENDYVQMMDYYWMNNDIYDIL